MQYLLTDHGRKSLQAVEIREPSFRSYKRVVAAISDFWFHDLRHTAATRMAERGIDPFTIAAIMGHTDIKMTASYAHATASAKRAAVSALERASLEGGPQMGPQNRAAAVEGSRRVRVKHWKDGC